MLKIFFLLLLTLTLNANTFTIASYNVENLFDLKNDNTEYDEFVPNTKSNWNEETFNIKINNILKVINESNADIIALQEVENIDLIEELMKKLPQYKYFSFIKYPNSAIGLGFLSKIQIKDNKNLDIKFDTKVFRPILETTFIQDNIEFKVFNNHWPSKAQNEAYRIRCAKVLQDRVTKLPKDYDYVLIGDFNADYNEMQTFKTNRKLNNSDGITGINHVLNSVVNDVFVTSSNILENEKRVHYNLWLEIPSNERFSSKYRNGNITPDNILIPPALFDTKKLSYIPNSFVVFKPNYLYENNIINKWQINEIDSNKIHKGIGYSDHLPIYAKFSTSNENLKIKKDEKSNTILGLYNIENLSEPIILNNAIVIYKNNDNAIIKKQNDRAIFIYKNSKDLKLGYSYKLKIEQISDFYGLKEIKSFTTLDELGKIENYKSLYLDGNSLDIFNFKYENEVITNLTGIVKKSKLYFDNNKYIKIYSQAKNLLPKDGTTITILKGHLASYKGNMQIILYEPSDFKIGY